jgi:multidrug resistance efflux pump
MRVKWIGAGLAVVVLAGAAAALGFAWPFGNRSPELKLPGLVEIQEVRLGPRVAGRVKEVLVKESDVVEAGQVLVRLDVPDLEAQRATWLAKIDEAEAEYQKATNGPRKQEKEAARAAAAAAKARLERLEAGFREEEKRQAAADYAAAVADEKYAQQEFDRESRLVNNGGKRADYDLARGNLMRAKGRAQSAKAKLDLVEAGSRKEDVAEAKAELLRLEAQVRLLDEGTRPEEIASASARLAEARAHLSEIEVSVNESVVKAVEPAVVELVTVRPGDLVQANQPVVRVLRGGDLWVKTYVPETELGRVRLGQTVAVTMDTFPGRRFEGKVIHVGNESEFTPRNVQSVDERRHQMFGVRIRIEDSKGLFKSGMAADVYVPAGE